MVTLMVHARKRVRWRLWRTESDLTETEECDLHQDASPTNWRETDSSVFRHKCESCALAGVGLAPAVYHMTSSFQVSVCEFWPGKFEFTNGS